jgi:hypothetical protein
MALFDDKKNVFTTIGAYTSLNEERELPESDNLYSSVNNKREITPFLLETLGIVVGTTALKELTGELFTNFADSSEPTLKSSMNSQLSGPNSDQTLPSSFGDDGYSMPMKKMDVYSKYKNTPDSNVGNLVYDKQSNSFDTKISQAISNPGTFVEYNNMSIRYNENLDTVTFKPTESSKNDSIGKWFSDYVNNTQFLNRKEFSSNVLNGFFGTLSMDSQKTIEELMNELKIDNVLNKLIQGDESFEVSESELELLFNKAEQLSKGVVYNDLGCGIFQTSLNINNFSDIISNISGSTDPFFVGNEIENALNNSFSNDINGVSDENEETLKNGFFSRLIEYIKLELSKLLTVSPQAKILLTLSASFNQTSQSNDPIENLRDNKTYINCLIKEILALLYEFIFTLIITVLVSLLKPIVRKIIKEKIKQFIGIIKSLVSRDV